MLLVLINATHSALVDTSGEIRGRNTRVSPKPLTYPTPCIAEYLPSQRRPPWGRADHHRRHGIRNTEHQHPKTRNFFIKSLIKGLMLIKEMKKSLL